jgi:hypothetical protein
VTVFASPLYAVVAEIIEVELAVEMTNCCGFVAFWTTDENPNVRFCTELGFALSLNKPIVLMALPGCKVPAKILDAAEGVIMHDFLEEDPEKTRKLIHDEFDRLTALGKITHVEGVCKHARAEES